MAIERLRLTQKIQSGWSDYYARVSASHRPPRDMFLRAIKRFNESGLVGGMAMDLGCGIGIESLELLRQGWQVLSVDEQQEAIDYLNNSLPAAAKARSLTHCGSFEKIDFPPCDFIWAGNSLPFCPAENLPGIIESITASLKPGGRFAGDFFAPRHAWAGNRNINTFTSSELRASFATLDAEYWTVGEGNVQAASHDTIHWHVHTIVMRKP